MINYITNLKHLKNLNLIIFLLGSSIIIYPVQFHKVPNYKTKNRKQYPNIIIGIGLSEYQNPQNDNQHSVKIYILSSEHYNRITKTREKKNERSCSNGLFQIIECATEKTE